MSDFDPSTFDPDNSFARIGEGSLGGKARALAFVRHCSATSAWPTSSRACRSPCRPAWCSAPTSSTLPGRERPAPLRHGQPTTTQEIERRFVAAAFPAEIERRLAAYLELVRLPAGRALVQPARGLPVPAAGRRLRDLHAAQQPRRRRRCACAQLRASRQAGVRFHLPHRTPRTTSRSRPTASRKRRWR